MSPMAIQKLISYQISTSAKCVSWYKWRKRQTTSLNLAPSLTSKSNNRTDFCEFHHFWPASNHVHLPHSLREMFILKGHSVLTWFLSEREGSHVPDGHQLMSHMAPKSCAMPSDKVGFDPELKERRAFQLNFEKEKGLHYLSSTDPARTLLLVTVWLSVTAKKSLLSHKREAHWIYLTLKIFFVVRFFKKWGIQQQKKKKTFSISIIRAFVKKLYQKNYHWLLPSWVHF